MRPSSAVDRSRELRALLGHERNALVEFILRLADFQRLKCWAELGYASLWLFLRKELGLSEAMASYRASAAELVGPRPKKAPARPRPAGGRYLPAEVRREVWSRDQGRCQEPLASGGICGATHR